MKDGLRMHGWRLGISGRLLALSAFLLAAAALFFVPNQSSALTTVPTKMNFQGRLTDSTGNIKPNGTYNMRLKLYTVSSAGTAVWSEDRLVSASQGITVTNGLFSIKLGDVTSLPASLFASGELYLEVELPSPATATSASPTWSEGPMTPRNQMATSAYAYNSETLDGLDSAAFGQLNADNQHWGGYNYFDIGLEVAGAFFGGFADEIFFDTLTGFAVEGSSLFYGGNFLARNDSTIFRNDANSAAAFSIQNSSSTNLFVADTSAMKVTVSGDLVVGAGESLTVTGGATGTRPSSPTEGMVYYDTTTKQLLTYANGKWQQDRTDTVLVAASNSSQADKDAADYVADGNTAAAADGDQIQVNAALSAASGKKVVLLAGTYVADATILIPNNTTLAGVGQGTVIELADLDATDNLIENSDTTTGTGVTIQNIKLNGRKDLNTAGTQHGIYLNNMGGGSGATARQGARLNGVVSVSFGAYGYYLQNSSNNIIEETTAQSNTSGGYIVSNGSYNMLTNNVSQGNTLYGIFLSNSSHNTVTGNATQGNAYGLYSSSGPNNTFTGNGSHGNSSGGITLNSSSRNTVSGNNFGDNGGSTNNNAIELLGSASNNTIAGNVIYDSAASTTNYAVNISSGTASANYLASNTLGAGSVNDTGTGTIYGGQVDASGNYAIQPAGNINLNKTTTVSSGTLNLGSTTTQGSLVVHDGNGQTATIRVADTAGSYVYTIPVTTANDTFCLQTLANCGGAGSGVTTVGALDGGTANANGATISGTTIYLQSASASYAGLVNTTTQTFAGNKTFSGTLAVSSTSTFTGTLTVGSGGDTITLSTTGLTLAGTARGTKTVTLVPEYQGATFRGDGSNNTGSLSSDLCSAATGGLSINTTVCASSNEEHNYYEWANTQSTAQDYDIYVRYKLPADYSTGSMTNLKFFGQGTTTSEAATLVMYSGSTQCASTGDVVTSGTTWIEGTVASPLGTCTPAAGAYVTFKITLSATQNNQARAGEISLTYRSSF